MAARLLILYLGVIYVACLSSCHILSETRYIEREIMELDGGTIDIIHIDLTHDIPKTDMNKTDVPKENIAPTAKPTAFPNFGELPLTVQFSALAMDIDGSIASFHWDFGDTYSSTEENPTHIYTTPGIFEVLLEIIDNDGKRSELSIPIKIDLGQRKTIFAPFTVSPITLDGDLSEFNKSPKAFISAHLTGTTCEYQLLWDDDALYIGYTSTDKNLNAAYTNKNSRLWEEDSAEIAFDTLNNHGSGSMPKDDDYKFIVNILGTTYDSRGGMMAPASWDLTTWTSFVKVNGTLGNSADTDKGYSVEIRIPWDSWGIKRPIYMEAFGELKCGLTIYQKTRNPKHYGQIKMGVIQMILMVGAV